MKIQRKAHGWRVFTPEFKRDQINRVVRGETTIAELSRELDVARPLLHRWKLLLTQGGERAIAADEDVVPVSRLRAAEQRIRDLERALGRQTMAVEILQAAQEEVKKNRVGMARHRDDGPPPR